VEHAGMTIPTIPWI